MSLGALFLALALAAPKLPACPENEPLTVTQPHLLQAVTLSTSPDRGAVNVHLDDGLDVVYKVRPAADGGVENRDIHQMIAEIGVQAYVTNTKVSVTWEGGKDIGAGYCVRWMVRITLEGKHGLIPWDHREQPAATAQARKEMP